MTCAPCTHGVSTRAKKRFRRRNLSRRAKNSASFDCFRGYTTKVLYRWVFHFCRATSTCSPHPANIMSTHVLEPGRPSVARPVLLVFLEPKMKATNSPENAIYLWTHQWPNPRPGLCQEWLSARNTWNALAQVWSAPFEEAPGLQC